MSMWLDLVYQADLWLEAAQEDQRLWVASGAVFVAFGLDTGIYNVCDIGLGVSSLFVLRCD